MLSPELKDAAQELVDRYPVARSALLPLLHLVQSEEGWVSPDGVAFCAEVLGLTKAEVAAVSTFYTMYKREPLGEHLVSVCTNFSCAVRGAKDVYARLSEKLGVGHNGTSADGKFTLEHAECLGNCEGAPVVTVDYLNYECVTPEQAEALLDRIAAGEVPPPTRGPIPPGARAVARTLSGLGPWVDATGSTPADAGVVAAPAPSGEVPATDPERESAAGEDTDGEPADGLPQDGPGGLSEAEAVAESAYDGKEFSSGDQGTGGDGERPVGEHDHG